MKVFKNIYRKKDRYMNINQHQSKRPINPNRNRCCRQAKEAKAQRCRKVKGSRLSLVCQKAPPACFTHVRSISCHTEPACEVGACGPRFGHWGLVRI